VQLIIGKMLPTTAMDHTKSGMMSLCSMLHLEVGEALFSRIRGIFPNGFDKSIAKKFFGVKALACPFNETDGIFKSVFLIPWISQRNYQVTNKVSISSWFVLYKLYKKGGDQPIP